MKTIEDLMKNLPQWAKPETIVGTIVAIVTILGLAIGLTLNPPSGSSQPPSPSPTVATPDKSQEADQTMPPVERVENKIVPKSGTIVADSARILSTSRDGEKLKVAYMSDQAPKVGQIFVINVTDNTPEGAIGRVEKVTPDGSGLLEVVLTPASIEDAYDAFSYNVQFTGADAIFYDGGEVEGDELHRRLFPEGFDLDHNQNWFECDGPKAKKEKKENGGEEDDEDTEVVKEGALNFASSLSDIRGEAIQDAYRDYAYLKAGVTVTWEASASQSVKCALNADKIPPIIVIPIAGPVSVTLKPFLEVGANGKVYWKYDFSVDGAVMAKNNRIYLDGSASGGSESGINGTVSAGIGLQASAGVKFGKGAEIYVKSGGEVVGGIEKKGEDRCAVLDLVPFVAGGWTVDIHVIDIGAERRFDLRKLNLKQLCLHKDSPFPTPPGELQSKPKNRIVATRPGILQNLHIYPGLYYKIESEKDGRSIYYGDHFAGTFVAHEGTAYGFLNGEFADTTPFEHIGMPKESKVAGARVIESKAKVPGTDLLVTQRDVFVEGTERYRTGITVENKGSKTEKFLLYRGFDCYLDNSDEGWGEVYPSTAACRAADGRLMSVTDSTGGATPQAGYFSTIWDRIATLQPFTGKADEGHYDNGMGLSWPVELNPGESKTYGSVIQLHEPVR